jgi:hypothetical protein
LVETVSPDLVEEELVSSLLAEEVVSPNLVEEELVSSLLAEVVVVSP